ncbi:MAG TPA: YihY/virulence factor BrkB family protein [Acidimicrobiales bacterium]|nr:YihY/virulence factor BrkB family protein [Acidimicrobiales bacterium]
MHRATPASRLAAIGASAAAGGAALGALVGRRSRPAPTQEPAAEEPAPRNPMAAAGPIKEEHADQQPAPPNKIVRRVDELQQRRPWLAFPLAVVRKFGDDSAGNLAALIAYYGFLSLFPLLLVLTTVLGTVLAGHPELQRRILSSALSEFPVIGDQLRTNVHSLHGSAAALVVGVAGALWGGMGVMKAAGSAMDDIWEVPKRERPTFVRALVRAALLLLVLGGGVVITTTLSGLGAGSGAVHIPLRAAGLVVAVAADVGIFLLGFRVLTVRDVGVRDLLPGAVVAGVAWFALQAVGSYYVGHQLKGASQTYGMFAVVLGLLSWMYLQAQLTLLAAEVNVVRAGRLWPRALTGDLTPADKRAYASYAEVEERRPEVEVGVGFNGNGNGDSAVSGQRTGRR